MNEERELLLMGRRPKRDPLDDYEMLMEYVYSDLESVEVA